MRNALQKLKNLRTGKENRNRIITINERSQTEEEIVDDIEKMPKKQRTRDINVELGEAGKRILKRVEKAREERESELTTEKPRIINKENKMLYDQHDSQLTSPGISFVFSVSTSIIGIGKIFLICWCFILLIDNRR